MAGPLVGPATIGLVASCVYVVLGVAGTDGYELRRLPVAVALVLIVGAVGGLLTGCVGGAVVWLLDQLHGERRSGRTDGIVGATVAAVFAGAFAWLLLANDVGQSTPDAVFFLTPAPFASAVAFLVGARIWRRTYTDGASRS